MSHLTRKQRVRYFTYLGLRAGVSLIDLAGILSVGFLGTSIALFLTLGSDQNRAVDFAGISIPAVTAQTLPAVSVFILALFVSKAVFSIWLTRSLANFLARIEAHSASTLVRAAYNLGLSGPNVRSREELYYAVQAGSPSAFNSLLNAIGTMFAESVLFLLVLVSFIVIDPLTGTLALIYFGAITGTIQFFLGSLMQRASNKTIEGTINANAAIGDLGEVLREASVLKVKEFFIRRVYDSRIRAASASANQYVLSGLPRYIVEIALILAVAGFVLAQVSRGDLVAAAGTAGVFLSGGLRLTASLLPMQGALLQIKQSIPAAQAALSLLDLTGIQSKSAANRSQSLDNIDRDVSIRLREVSFRYEGSSSEALKNINLEVKAGQQVALIGPSGSGKSTLADVILGLVKPTVGSVIVSGADPSAVIETYPGLLGYVPQRPGMVSGTILENIALGVPREEVSQADLQRAIADSHLKAFIDNLPLGLETDLGKRRDELSGGQLQRIGLARALYSNPRLLVMDEATSSLDADSENEINRALDEMRGKVTVVLIAHRLNTVQRSDVVFLVESGSITAAGTFQELLRTNETVQNLAKLMSIDAADNLQD